MLVRVFYYFKGFAVCIFYIEIGVYVFGTVLVRVNILG